MEVPAGAGTDGGGREVRGTGAGEEAKDGVVVDAFDGPLA